MIKHAFCIAGAGSGVGKTTITIGLLRALKKRGLSPAPFKCGPDYIDPGFHKIACGTVSRNLDTWMMGEKEVKNSFITNCQNNDIAIVEGVMGLFDGSELGKIIGSTAHVAKILNLPVMLVINARGIAGTIAPLVKGFVDFKKGVKIAGIIANNVGSDRHAEMLAEALQKEKLPPLLGYLPRNPNIVMPERHLGLVPTTENKEDFYDVVSENIEQHFDVEKILKITKWQHSQTKSQKKTASDFPGTKMAYALDDAFHFYYEDNLDMLRAAGIELVPFSPIDESKLPEGVKGIYIGGGFPECFAVQLAANNEMKQAISSFVASGGFIYAECGGLMYLTNGITTNDEQKHEMCGIIPVWTKMENRLRALGYREVQTLEKSPLGPKGTVFKGHEFHWSSVINEDKQGEKPFCEIRNARKSEWEPAGYRYKNVFASYIHAHFASNKQIINNIKAYLLDR